MFLMPGTEDMPRHGSPADRGAADAWYSRPKEPHYYEGATMASPWVGKARMTQPEIDDYNRAYDAQKGRKEY